MTRPLQLEKRGGCIVPVEGPDPKWKRKFWKRFKKLQSKLKKRKKETCNTCALYGGTPGTLIPQNYCSHYKKCILKIRKNCGFWCSREFGIEKKKKEPKRKIAMLTASKLLRQKRRKLSKSERRRRNNIRITPLQTHSFNESILLRDKI